VRERPGHPQRPRGALAVSVSALASLASIALPLAAGANANATRALETIVEHMARVVVQTAPVRDDGALVALVGVQTGTASGRIIILGDSPRGWTTQARLAVSQFPIVPATTVQIARATGDGRPDFLVLVAGADNTPGVVVGQVGGRWELIRNAGPFPTSPYVARNPRFVENRLVSQYDNCTPNCAAGTTTPIDWTFDASRGEFVAPNPPGWVAPAGALNHRAA
jgi:hypothetical protein